MKVTNETKDLLIDYLIIKKTLGKNTNYFFKKGLLLVGKIKSVVAFKMSELVMISKDGFPNSNV